MRENDSENESFYGFIVVRSAKRGRFRDLTLLFSFFYLLFSIFLRKEKIHAETPGLKEGEEDY